MRLHLSVRSRLTLLYASLFALCGTILVTVTYTLVAHHLSTSKTPATTNTNDVQQLIQQCVVNSTAKGALGGDAKTKCAALYADGVKAGASAQGDNTLNHLLTDSLITLAGVIVLMVIAGWVIAGRILRPIHAVTVAARTASEQNLSHRLGLHGPHDELRELGDTFDDMLARLEGAFTTQRQFIANAGHELRTPLTVMRTSIDVVLAKGKPSNEELLSMSADIRDAVEHTQGLITALLTLARSDQTNLVQAPLDLATVAEDALDLRACDGLTVTRSLDAAPVSGDAVLLEHLIGNLIDNAQQYNLVGGSIAISTTTSDGRSILRITNTGQLVPAEQVNRLLLPFTRLDDRTRQDGFGLGLAIVASITAAHGGTLRTTPVPTGGLDISVDLPRLAMPEHQLQDADATRQ